MKYLFALLLSSLSLIALADTYCGKSGRYEFCADEIAMDECSNCQNKQIFYLYDVTETRDGMSRPLGMTRNRNEVCRSIIMNNLGGDAGDVHKIQYKVSLRKNVLSCSVKWKNN